jgi:hypothetical protein
MPSSWASVLSTVTWAMGHQEVSTSFCLGGVGAELNEPM